MTGPSAAAAAAAESHRKWVAILVQRSLCQPACTERARLLPPLDACQVERQLMDVLGYGSFYNHAQVQMQLCVPGCVIVAGCVASQPDLAMD